MLALNERPLFAGSAVDNEPVRLSLYPGTSDELSRVWALFPDQNYRTSVLYLASPVWIDPDAARAEAPPVVFDRKRTGALEMPRSS
jgi:Pvc16 N-terminal domain